MKSIVLIAVSALCGCRSPSPLPVVTVTERVRSFPVKDSLSLTALIRVDTLKRIVLSEVQASATPNMRYRLSLDTLPDASRLRLDVYNVRDSVRLIERDSVVFVPSFLSHSCSGRSFCLIEKDIATEMVEYGRLQICHNA